LPSHGTRENQRTVTVITPNVGVHARPQADQDQIINSLEWSR
jgi:hypothetical protein